MPQVGGDVAGGDQTVAQVCAHDLVSILHADVRLVAELAGIKAVARGAGDQAKLHGHQRGVVIGHGIGADQIVLLPNLDAVHEIDEVLRLVIILNRGAVGGICQNAEEVRIAKVVDILGHIVGLGCAGNVVMVRIDLLHRQQSLGNLIIVGDRAPIDIRRIGVRLLAQVHHGRGIRSDRGQRNQLAIDPAAIQDLGVVLEKVQNLRIVVDQLRHVCQLAIGIQRIQRHVPERRKHVDGITSAGEQQVELLLHVAKIDPNQVDLRAAGLAEDLIHSSLN